MLKPLDQVFAKCREECLRIPLLGNPISNHFKTLFAQKLPSLRGGFKSILYGIDVVCLETDEKKRSFMPMTAFYIAYSLCDLYSTLIEYKKNVIRIFNDDRIRELKKTPKINEIERKQLKSLFTRDDAELLEKFLTNYEWWGGGKTIDRANDFFISPLMKCALLHAETQSNIADITCILAENADLYDALASEVNTVTMLNINRIQKCSKQFYSAIRTKPFLLLAGISGTGKSRIVRRMAQATVPYEFHKELDKNSFDSIGRWTLQKPANFELIQVKPNWHNSMDVIGFQTNLSGPHYVFTPFVEFVVKAWQHPEVPFFLCLDEMNLAPVEEYFAEYLSAIESRTKDGDLYKTDPIVPCFDSFGEIIRDQMIRDLKLPDNGKNKALACQFREDGLTLPENLIVIGTVNMDETTCSFSRKVLDRAMSFEMNEVDFDQFLRGESDPIREALTEEQIRALIHRPNKADEVKGNIDSNMVISYLKAINEILDGTPFKLGYRAANEALLYVDASRVFGQDDIATALDEFTLMKILSRIEGDSSKLAATKTKDHTSSKTILSELKDVIECQLNTYDESAEGPNSSVVVDGQPNDNEHAAKEDTPSTKRELKSIKKLDRMINQLEQNGFVSYWE